MKVLPSRAQQRDIIYDLHRGKFGAGAPVFAPREEWPGTILESEIVPNSINDVTILSPMPGEMRRPRLLSVRLSCGPAVRLKLQLPDTVQDRPSGQNLAILSKDTGSETV